ncbi:MAG: hypothetical protein JWO90_2384 [Solirubrobacterales bacterium]|nr:hypothetical protein [Solirubrobacterales bacterium]
MPLTPRTLLRATLACLALCAAFSSTASPAAASENQLSMMMDDDLLVYRNDDTRDAALRRMKGLGVDTVRVTLLWSVLGDEVLKTKKRYDRFKRLGAENPRAYPSAVWDRYDRLTKAVDTLGMGLYFNVTGPGPAFAHTKPPKKYKKDAKWWRPKPREFYKFVQAVGKRYSGTFRDENDGRGRLARVSFWSIWNEPNQGGWLRPQWLGGKPVSPEIYRDLYAFGRRALVSTGHGNDTILVGETAPRSVSRKTTTSAMGVRTFVSEFLCGPGHRSAGCSRFKKDGPVVATAFAHHPYTRTLAPSVPEKDPNSITLANLSELGTLLDGLAATGNIRSGMPIMSTEFGYETAPPDPFAGVSLQQQADYIAQSEALTYLNPRVAAHTQFLLRDVLPVKRFKTGSRPYWGTYQSGLFDAQDRAKPAATAYAFPFLAAPGAPDPATGQPKTTVFGQIRFRDNVPPGGTPDTVQLQFKPADGSSDWIPFNAPLATSRLGYFFASVDTPGRGLVRAVWKGAQIPFNFTSAEKPV